MLPFGTGEATLLAPTMAPHHDQRDQEADNQHEDESERLDPAVEEVCGKIACHPRTGTFTDRAVASLCACVSADGSASVDALRHLLAASLAGLALGCSSNAPPATPSDREPRAASLAAKADPGSSAVEALGDTWVGGFGPVDGTGAFVRVDFSAGTIRLHPREDRAPLGIVRPRADRDPAGRERIHFTAYEGSHLWTFDLRRAGPDALEGVASDPKAGSANVRLLHAQAPDRRAVDTVLSGTYAVDGDPRKLLFIENGRLFDTRDGSERRLFLLTGGRALVGRGVGTAHPSGGIARVDAAELRIEQAGSASLVASPFEVRKEEVRFVSDGVPLQGVFTSPPGPGPFPTVVFVHGSGHSTRKDPWENAMARVLASEGYAMFLYDKRGVGDSGGEYVGAGGQDTNNVSQENIERLARDARAAFAAIGARRDVDTRRLGFFGLSQAGWIIPLAARGNKAVRFVVMISTPTVPVAVQLAYQTLDGDGVTCLSIADAGRVTRDHAPRTGYDPAPAIAALDVPGLWIYGSSDPLVPFAESMGILEGMKKRDFTVKLAPGAGHELFVVAHDTEDERQLSRGVSAVAIEALRTWLRAQARALASR